MRPPKGARLWVPTQKEGSDPKGRLWPRVGPDPKGQFELSVFIHQLRPKLGSDPEDERDTPTKMSAK